MFDRLVVSTSNRRRGRTVRFFACTSVVYLSVAAVAFAASIYFTTPKLADTSLPRFVEGIVFPITRTPDPGPRNDNAPATAATPDPRNVQKLDSIIENLGNSKQPIVPAGPPGKTDVVGGPGGDGDPGPGTPGIPGIGDVIGAGSGPSQPPVPPDPPKPKPQQVANVKPLIISSKVLQGKAIDKAVPLYPELAKRNRISGDVSVEVIISPEGRVESVRVVSGHPLFVTAALDAARRWRFEPTILNGVPVRVTGVITFVFKLNE